MSPQNLKKNLTNWDLVSVNPNDKNWDWKTLFCYWGVNIQSIIGFSLIASLYLIYNLNTFVVFFGTIIASLLVYFLSNLIGKPSQKNGLPFIVLLRSSLGIKGAKYFGLIRFFVGVFLFGIQTYFLSKVLSYLIRIGIFSFDPALLDQQIFLTFFLGMNLIDWFSILVSIIFQGFLFTTGMNFNKKIIIFSATAVYIGMLFFFLSVLLNDVKFTSKAFLNSLNFSNFLDKNNINPLITVTGTMFAYFSIVILSFGDFSRYVKDSSQLQKGNFSLISNLIIFSFFALFIVSGMDAFLKQDPENLTRILTNPTDIIGKLENLFLIILALIFIIIASASTNLITNFIPSQYALINFFPFSLSVKSAGLIITIIGFIVGIFWLTFLSQVGALSFIDTFGAFFGPLFGVMISDFYFIQKGKLDNKDIYSLESNGIYYYSGGWHIKAIYSVILGFIFSASTIWNTNLMFLQSFSWIIGAFVAALTYYLLAKE
ncbi:cytosine permease [Candidatus Pelagibacter communis]|uniref:cytosine permease n=1 Tax=Pelagibacter ubique TaxID=198252 RepID=UPI00094CAF72|nr:cytosine permease [Candidatus Pelagibacter ubique]